MATSKEVRDFITKIAPLVQKYAKQFGYHVASPIIAQACLESGYGTTAKSKYHNYFGLKYRENRCPSASGYFTDASKEQRKDGTYYDIVDKWFKFKDMDDGVKGYFEFISVSNYDKLRTRNITDPKTYLKTIKECNYATSIRYVENNYRIVVMYNLTQYDNFDSQATQKETQKNTATQITTQKEATTQIATKKETQNIPETKTTVKNNDKNTQTDKTKFEIGDKIILNTDVYYNGKKIPAWVKKSTLYFRGYNSHGTIFSTKKIGSITGVVESQYVSKA